MASTSLSQRWLSEVKATGTLINRKSLSEYSKPKIQIAAQSAAICIICPSLALKRKLRNFWKVLQSNTFQKFRRVHMALNCKM